jgi:4-hydroxybenzoate polyprenyltransferase
MGDFNVDLLSRKDDVITCTFSAFEQNIKWLLFMYYIYMYLWSGIHETGLGESWAHHLFLGLTFFTKKN